MNLYRSLITALAVAMLAALLGAAPASAVTYVAVDADNLVVPRDDCKRTPVTIEGDWGNDESSDITVDVYDSDGSWSVGNSFTRFAGDDETIVWRALICGYEPTGTYEVQVAVESYDELGDVTYAEDWTTFRVTRPEKARSSIKRRVRNANQPDGDYAVVGQLLRNGRGYARRTVVAQVRVDGDWYDAGSMRTRRRGAFGWYFDANRYTWRYVFRGNDRTKASRSRTFRLPRSGARVTARLGDVDPSTLLHRR